MQPEAKPTGDPSRRFSRPFVIAIAADDEMHRRIAGALAEQNLCVSAQLEVVNEVERPAPDDSIVIFACDVDAPREIASLRRLCREVPELMVVVISPPATGPGVRRALDAGATGLVFDSELELNLTTAIRAVVSGQSVVPRKLRAGVERPVLSHRERQVLALVRNGLTNAQIAKRLFLAESTIKSHLASIFTKLGVRSRKEVAAAFDDMEREAPVVTSTGGPVKQVTA